ncbi:MAG TPA: methionyl-tRNA formyltransferase [Bacteroidia bacterium]|jgi:methionyl-tRNA formyltransferase|nr:methionyl-tRNA formyltransferase [Bacteroidia bacterium]
MRIVFMGTPQFAVESLKILVENKYNIVGVITSPDKPAGRGQQVQQSAVKQFAVQHNLNVLQPTNLKDESFLQELKSLQADLQIVVAFRMLPESVWNMPPLGTYNLHASMLPQYRGAAPINWAIINGEKETGITTFKLQHEIDTGNILMQQKVSITPEMNAGQLHDILMMQGADLMLQTVKKIEQGNIILTEQNKLLANQQAKHAPKIFKDTCQINCSNSLEDIYNLIRGLSPYPCAWTELNTGDKKTTFKIYQASKEEAQHSLSGGQIKTDNKTFLKIAAKGGFIDVTELQMAGKKKLLTTEFLKGFSFDENSFFA